MKNLKLTVLKLFLMQVCRNAYAIVLYCITDATTYAVTTVNFYIPATLNIYMNMYIMCVLIILSTNALKCFTTLPEHGSYQISVLLYYTV